MFHLSVQTAQLRAEEQSKWCKRLQFFVQFSGCVQVILSISAFVIGLLGMTSVFSEWHESAVSHAHVVPSVPTQWVHRIMHPKT